MIERNFNTWENFMLLFHKYVLDIKASWLGTSKIFLGRVISNENNNIKVDLHKRSVKYPSWFTQDFNHNPQVGDLVPIYATKYCNANGEIKLNQERLVYLMHKWLLKHYFEKGITLKGIVNSTKWRGLTLDILPHTINGENKTFKVFMPYHKSQFEISEGDELEVKIIKLNMRQRNIIVEIDNSFYSKKRSEAINKMYYNKPYSGKITNITPYGMIVDINSFGCFLARNNLRYSNEISDKEYYDTYKVGMILEGLLISNKNVESSKVYLRAEHSQDKLENYIKDGQTYDAEIIRILGRKVLIAVNDIKLQVNFTDIYPYSHSIWDGIQPEGNKKMIKVCLSHKKTTLISANQQEDRDKYWDKVAKKYPLRSVVRLNLDKTKVFLQKEGVIFCTDSYNQPKGIINKISKLYSRYDQRDVSKDYLVISYLRDKGEVLIESKINRLRYEMLLMPRMLKAEIVQIKNNTINLKIGEFLYSEINIRSLSKFMNLQIGSKIDVKVTGMNFIKASVSLEIA